MGSGKGDRRTAEAFFFDSFFVIQEKEVSFPKIFNINRDTNRYGKITYTIPSRRKYR